MKQTEITTVKQLLDGACRELNENSVPEAELNAWYLLVKAYEEAVDKAIDKAWLFTQGDEEAPEKVIAHLKSFVAYRSKGTPLEYITHETEFMGLNFYVDFRVLIPRQDTECLVEEAMKHCKGKTVLDMCTGSGCIAISLEKLAECASVTASDISSEALAVAKINAKNNNSNIEFIQSDLWKNITKKYDIITCNPPYIKRDVIPTLMREVKDFEPVLALDGGESGLDKYELILSEIKEHLNEGAMAFFEIGYDQGEAVSDLFEKAGFTDVKVTKDLAGNDRVVSGTFL